MLRAAIGFFIVGFLSIVFGFYNIAGLSLDIGRTLLFVFFALAVISLIANIFTGRNKPIL